jgi:adenylyltransferase/sulfurtransferase
VTGRSAPALDEPRLARWARQLLVPGFGEAAQQRLAAAQVRAVGAGPVTSTALVCLVQAGVGRIWIDDAGPVGPQDATGTYLPGDLGRPRAEAAADALSALSRYTVVQPYPAGGVPTAALVGVPPVAPALHAAEAARRAGLPHVVLEPDGEGGSVVSVPPGGPCYACARSTGAAGRPALAGAAALGALAAQELVNLIAAPEAGAGRRLDLLRGIASVRPTVRLVGCACAKARTAAAG